MMRIIVCGGRYFTDVPLLWSTLDQFQISRGPVDLVIDGASDDVTGPYIGADYWAHQWAIAHDIPTLRMHADWHQFGKAAGPIRNKKMRDDGYPRAVIAFAGGRGTQNMIALAIASEIEVIEIKKNEKR